MWVVPLAMTTSLPSLSTAEKTTLPTIVSPAASFVVSSSSDQSRTAAAASVAVSPLLASKVILRVTPVGTAGVNASRKDGLTTTLPLVYAPSSRK